MIADPSAERGFEIHVPDSARDLLIFSSFSAERGRDLANDDRGLRPNQHLNLHLKRQIFVNHFQCHSTVKNLNFTQKSQ